MNRSEGEVLRELHAIKLHYGEAIAEAHKEKENAATRHIKHSGRIEFLKARANGLASQFKEKYAESNVAYIEGDGELAKTLSLEGHALQEECEALNFEIGALCRTLGAAGELVREKFRKADELRKKLDELRKELSDTKQRTAPKAAARPSAKHVVISGFPESEIAEVRSLLSTFPTRIVGKLECIIYEPTSMKGKRGVPISGRTKLWRGGQYFMEIFKHEESVGEHILETVSHEVGHIAFSTLSPKEKRAWERLYANTNDSQFVTDYAMRSAEEDFCECVMKFKANPIDLAQIHPGKYAFVKGIAEETNHEKT